MNTNNIIIFFRGISLVSPFISFESAKKGMGKFGVNQVETGQITIIKRLESSYLVTASEREELTLETYYDFLSFYGGNLTN